jgi:hypothetical protein
MTVAATPWALQKGSHSAQLARLAGSSLLNAAGGTVVAKGLEVTEHSAANMSVNVAGGIPNGAIWVPGTTTATQGQYFCWNESTTNLGIGAASEANPRIDTVVAQVKDEALAGVGNEFTLSVVAGTPEAGATLENLKGAGAVPASSLVLAYVLVPAKAASIKNAEIKNVVSPINSTSSPFVLRTGNFTARWGEAALVFPTAGVCTLPAPAQGLLEIWNISGGEETIKSPGAGVIYGDFVQGPSEFKIAKFQHVQIRSDGTNYYIVAGEPKREELYGAKVLKTEGVEYEPNATRPSLIIAMIEANVAENTTATITVGGKTIIEVTLGTAQLTLPATFIVPPGQKWKWTKVAGAITVRASQLNL